MPDQEQRHPMKFFGEPGQKSVFPDSATTEAERREQADPPDQWRLDCFQSYFPASSGLDGHSEPEIAALSQSHFATPTEALQAFYEGDEKWKAFERDAQPLLRTMDQEVPAHLHFDEEVALNWEERLSMDKELAMKEAEQAQKREADARRMILAAGDCEAGRREPEDFDFSRQPETVTALYQAGIFAYNGTDRPELTEKGREAYNDLDRTRTDRPPVKIEQRKDPEEPFDPTKFFTRNRKAQDERPTDPEQKGMSPEALQAARNLVREADKAVTLMQERGIGMNEAGLSKALQSAHAAGIEPPEKEPRTMKFSVFRDAGIRHRDDPGREPER